jgi:hypothetical protein
MITRLTQIQEYEGTDSLPLLSYPPYHPPTALEYPTINWGWSSQKYSFNNLLYLVGNLWANSSEFSGLLATCEKFMVHGN